jgi:hypothetical protein
VAFGAGESSPFCPATVAVHDAGDMDGRWLIRRIHSEHLTDVDSDDVRQ